MHRKVAGAVLALIVVVGGSACGSTRAAKPVTTTERVSKKAPLPLTLPAAASLVLIPTEYGAGNEQFGTFTASGTVYFEFSCKGEGPLTIAGILQHISPCDGSPTGASVPYHAGERVHLAVHAKPGTTWRLAVGEHVPGADLVLVHRSGVGYKSLGRFQLRGTVTIALTCKGRSAITVRFNPNSPSIVPDEGTYCPQTVGDAFSFPVPVGAHAVPIYLDAPPKVRWTITISETK